MIKASNQGICVEFWRKNNTTLVYLLSNCWHVLNIFQELPVKYYFWRFQYMIFMI